MFPSMLVATHNAFLMWTPHTGETVLHSGSGVYYGITWSKDCIWVVARGNEPSRMLAFQPNFYLIDPPPFEHMGPPDDGPHQAFYDEASDTLHVTNTQCNRVERWRVGDGEPLEPVYFEESRGVQDIDHVNSLQKRGGVWYVLEHRLDRMPKRIRLCDANWNLVRTIEIHNECLSAGPTHSGCHNITVVGDGSYVTLGPSQLILDGVEFSWPFRVEANKHYLRGLARNHESLYVGVSNASPQGMRGWGASRVLRLSPAPPFQIEGELALSAEFGQIMDIRMMCDDLAHNGLTCPWVLQ